MPVLTAVLSGIGLLSALLGDDIWDALSWFGLGVPVAVILWFAGQPAKKPLRSAESGPSLPHR